ncbi:RHS repeat-associated core domain-containing protein, partial [bacterium]|nr:RHS repeat-associated core domain-containing protein [bacterium]
TDYTGQDPVDYYYHKDGLGSVVTITDSNAAIVEKYFYDAYGNITIKDAQNNTLSESAINNTRFFTGRIFDKETGLYYYRERIYSSDLGRFLQVDPLNYYDSSNLYQFCQNNSVNLIDPFGLFTLNPPIQPTDRPNVSYTNTHAENIKAINDWYNKQHRRAQWRRLIPVFGYWNPNAYEGSRWKQFYHTGCLEQAEGVDTMASRRGQEGWYEGENGVWYYRGGIQDIVRTYTGLVNRWQQR